MSIWYRTSRAILASVYLLAFLAPTPAAAFSSVELGPDDTFFDHEFVLDEETLLHVTFDSNVACPLNHATTIDPWLRLFSIAEDGTATVIADDDDGNHSDGGNCYGSKISTTLAAGSYRLRFRTFQEQAGLAVPEGSGTVSWSSEGYEPAPPTTTTTSTTTSTTTTAPPTTTTEQPFIGPPMNLVVEDTGQEVKLDWDEPNVGNVEPEHYAVNWRFPTSGGWTVESETTSAIISYEQIESTGGFGEEYVFSVRSDNDTQELYSGWSNEVTLTVAGPPPTTTSTTTTTLPPTTTTTSSTTSTTTTVPVTTTTEPVPSSTTTPPPTTTQAPPPTTTTTTSSTLPPTTTTATTTTTTTTTTVAPTTTSSPPPTTTASTTTSSSTVPPTTVPPTTSTTTSTTTVAPTTTSTTTLPPAVEEAVEILETFEDEELAQELEEIFVEEEVTVEEAEALIEVVEEVLGVEGLDEEQIEELVDDVVEVMAAEVVTEEAIEELVSNESFDELSEEAVGAIGISLNDDSYEVRETFEEEVNVFGSDELDEYVPSGSRVPVEDRRVVIAGTAAVAIGASPRPAPPAAAASSSGGSSGPAGPSRRRR